MLYKVKAGVVGLRSFGRQPLGRQDIWETDIVSRTSQLLFTPVCRGSCWKEKSHSTSLQTRYPSAGIHLSHYASIMVHRVSQYHKWPETESHLAGDRYQCGNSAGISVNSNVYDYDDWICTTGAGKAFKMLLVNFCPKILTTACQLWTRAKTDNVVQS